MSTRIVKSLIAGIAETKETETGLAFEGYLAAITAIRGIQNSAKYSADELSVEEAELLTSEMRFYKAKFDFAMAREEAGA